MKKTFIILMLVLLSLVLVVSCDNSTALPSVSKEGDTVKLGSVTWLALSVDTENKKALLISQDILEKRKFHSASNTSSEYSSSAIYKYLKDNFISEYGLSTDYMLKVDTSATTTTPGSGSDYVFLLSQEEAQKTEYFADKGARIAEYEKTATVWWTRTAGTSSHVTCAVAVKEEGDIDNETAVTYEYGLRPAFWYTWATN